MDRFNNMNTVYLIWFFVIGCVFGSFFGVVGTRLSEEKSIVKPRSHCDHCGHELKWYELIPIFSYIIQKGKCNSCKKELSIFYPIIELISGLLFSICFFIFGFSSNLGIALLIVSFLVIVIVSDLTYLIIPDEVTLFFSITLILYKIIFFGFKNAFFSILNGILLFFIMYIIMLIGNKMFKKETLGGADIKLMFFIGLVLEQSSLGIFNIFLSSFIALPISIISLIKNKNNVIPFGPFILISLFLIFCFK